MPNIWTEQDSSDFLRFGVAFVPDRDTQHRLISGIVKKSLKNGRILELCCGAGDLAKRILDENPTINLEVMDDSPAMLDSAGRLCEPHARRFSSFRSNLTRSDLLEGRSGLDTILSSLAIHHLDDEQKQRLFKQIFGALRPGGIFVYADMTMPATEFGLEIAAQQWEEAVQERSLSLYGDGRAVHGFNSLEWNYYLDPAGDPSDKPANLAAILEWLREAGFSDIEIHWLKAAHVLLSAKRSE
ncbi:methyltransferase [Paraburkholderia agricolaris]|uniref:Methyltransferase n=1 Tax=Paraburkholderia agricolaris TaxID=2152888 RepID=A0ABW9A031_9BURK